MTAPWNSPADRKPRHPFRMRIAAIGISLCVSVGLMAAKFYTYRLTGSSAVLSDALESIINVVAAAFAVVSIWMAARPPDADHPYGHGKIEYFSAGFEGALIIFAAVGIFKTGIAHLIAPEALVHLRAGLIILLAAAAVNLVLGIGLIKVGNRWQSLTLVADGRHVLADVTTSIGVVVGLVLVQWTGWLWLDGLIACLVGVHILFVGTRLVRQSFAALMDASDAGLLDDIAGLLAVHRRDLWIDVHRLRAWRSGRLVHIDLHLVLPRDVTLEEAHTEAKNLEQLLIHHFEGEASVLIHMDPCTSPDCPGCRLYRCKLRAAAPEGTRDWTRHRLTISDRRSTADSAAGHGSGASVPSGQGRVK